MQKIVGTMGGVGLVLLLGLVPSLQAGPLTCGSSVSGLVVFDSDLACSGDGLTVVEPDTTIDLAGFTLSCAGNGYRGSCQGLRFTGITTDGFSNIQIKNGTISGFQVGVRVRSGSNVTVQDLTVTGPASPGARSNPRPDATGILVTATVCPDPAATVITIFGNDVSNHREGIELSAANCVNVGFNHLHTNNSDPLPCHGILADNSGSNEFNNNLVDRNGENRGGDGGLTLSGSGTADNVIRFNNVSLNCGDGISVRDGAHDNVLSNNIARDNATSTLGGLCDTVIPGAFFDFALRDAGPDNVCVDNIFLTGACP